MITEKVVKYAKKLGADDVVATLVSGETRQIRFANNSVSVLQNWSLNKLNIFLSVKKRIVRTTLDDISENKVESAIKNLIKISKQILPKTDYHGIAEGKFKYQKVKDGFDKKIAGMSEECVDIVEASINKALEYSKRTAGVLYTNAYDKYTETSTGISAQDKMTSIQISIRAFNEKDESGHGVACARVLNKFNPEQAGQKAGQISNLAKKPVQGTAGKYDVVFDPLSFSDLIGLVGRFSSAFSVDTGFSFLGDKINKNVASRQVTLIDNGIIANGFNSSSFDDEGVPSKETKIIDKGVLKTYLHNTTTAAKYKTKTTASAGLIAPEPKNTILKPGNITKEKLFSEIKNGIYITDVWYTRFQNYRTGDFSTIPRDGIFVIKNGEITKSIKNVRVSDNLERILKNVITISNKPEWIQWWEVTTPVYTPYVLVKDVSITLPTM